METLENQTVAVVSESYEEGAPLLGYLLCPELPQLKGEQQLGHQELLILYIFVMEMLLHTLRKVLGLDFINTMQCKIQVNFKGFVS